MIAQIIIGCLLAILAIGSNAAPNDRIPDWLSISPKLSSIESNDSGSAFPLEADRATWKRDGFGYVDLLWRIEIHIERSGLIKERIEIVRHFLSESGISQGGNMELFANAWRDQITIETGYSISANATANFVDPDTIEVVPVGRENVFSDEQRIILPIPGLQAGSNAKIVGTRQFQSNDFPLSWSRIVSLQSTVPIARIEVFVSADEGSPEIDWISTDSEIDCEEIKGKRLHCIRSDVPSIAFDRDVINYPDYIPHLYIGHTQTWQGLQSEVRALIEESAKISPSVRDKVAELQIDPNESDANKLLKLLRFVADEIRYVSISHGDSTVKPHAASLTLERRYGDCKDKVALLVAMGSIIDLDVIPVLTSTVRTDRQAVVKPSSSYFNHMIACIETDDLAEPICVDPTQAYSNLELPPALGGAISLPLGQTTEASIGNLMTADFGWEIFLHRESSLERDGSVNTKGIRRFFGPGAASNRSQLLGIPWTERKIWIETEYRDAFGTTTVPAFTFRSLRDPSVPYEIESSLSFSRGHQSDANELVISDSWLVYYARSMISVNRHHPYRLLGLRYTAEETITPCCGEIIHYGPTLEFESKYGSLRRKSRKVNGQLIVKTILELPAAVVPPEDVPELETFIMQSIRESALWLSWTKEETAGRK